ncbi:ATP-binding protein [candidate division CSSED10-310 bacterium]|uniref:histidine kinase n=1 Tax=candidate division CSSED10-310 bacterium TaxID=2855610 RepID=A0ABV6Z2F7_UNCC1
MEECSEQYCLEVVQGPDKGLIFPLGKNVVTTGRSWQSDISLSDNAVSRQHFQISQSKTQADRFHLKDLDSRNGVFLNRKRVSFCIAQPADRIRIGGTTFTIRALTEQDLEQQASFKPPPDQKKLEPEENLIATIDVQNVKIVPLDLKKMNEIAAEKRLRTLYRMSDIMTLPTHLEEKFQSLLDIIFEVIPAENGCILLKDSGTGKLEPIAVKKSMPDDQNMQIKLSWTIIEKSIFERIGILTYNATEDPRFDLTDSIIDGKMQAVLSVPLFIHDSLLGVIFLNTSLDTGQFSEDDLAFLTGIANDAALVIEHNQLIKTRINRAKNAEVGELVTSLSHYLSSILADFVAKQAVIDEAVADEDFRQIEQTWPLIKKDADRIGDLVNDMLYFTKQKKSEKKIVSFHNIIKNVVSLIKPITDEKEISLNLALAENIPLCNIDPHSFQRVILMLVQNALDAVMIAGTGSITLKTDFSKGDDFVEFSVMDDGVGIPAVDVENIFHYLYSTKGHEGTGFGLYITRQIVEDHGGRISVWSEVGKGSHFTIRIPVHHH